MIATIAGTAMAGGTIVIITRLRHSANSNALARIAKGEPGGSPFAIL
jgi:hypothetical protein